MEANTFNSVKHTNDLVPMSPGMLAYQNIKDALNNKSRFVNIYSLKRMDAHELAKEIITVLETNKVDTTKIREAILLAAYLHRYHTRSTRLHHDVTPYIEHPLRNTLRLIRYGIYNEDILVGCVLHDTVEDNVLGYLDLMDAEYVNENEARRVAYSFLTDKFTVAVKSTVEGLTNPILPDDVSREYKQEVYCEHVAESIVDSKVFLCKVSDYIDNAFSLYHSKNYMSSESIHSRATKYLKVYNVLRSRLLAGISEKNFHLDIRNIQKLYIQLDSGYQTLVELHATNRR